MKLYNSLTNKIEDFVPLTNTVKIYVCGPTVYDRIHIGNARPIVIFDLLHRILKYKYKNVVYVRNITDVDDKIIQRAKDKNCAIEDLVNTTILQFHNDIYSLNVLQPTYEPRASKYITEMLDMIQTLIDKKFAYITKKGNVWFDVLSYKNYGTLSNRKIEEMLLGVRIEPEEDKKNPIDFALWKSVEEYGFKSQFGYGRPGWHIECSAMSKALLGDVFDIHCGGRDLTFPHHENEIAQSCCANNNDTMSRFWLHNDMVTTNGAKMAKSTGNIIYLEDANKKYTPEVVKIALMMSHYNKTIDWNDNLIKMSQAIINQLSNIKQDNTIAECPHIPCIDAIMNNLDTPTFFTELYKLLYDINQGKDNLIPILNKTLEIVGLENLINQPIKLTIEESILMQTREDAKQKKDYQTADSIRQILLHEHKLEIKDTKNGTEYKRIK